MKKPLKQLRKNIEKKYGKKCKDFSLFCSTCIAYKVLEDMERLSKHSKEFKKTK